jgi:methoxymalonate biosynthesis acyl carrier protein
MSDAGDREAIRSFLASLTGGPALGDEDDLFARGLLSSLYALQLVKFVESRFGVALADEDLDLQSFRSIDAIARLVARRRGG